MGIEGRPTATRSRSQARKDEIIAIAARMFATKGYDGTSLRDIADIAGLTKAALYYHFPDKEQIYEVVVTTRMSALLAAVTEAVEQAPDDPIVRIRAFLVASARRIDDDRVGWLASSHTFWSIANKQGRETIVGLRDQFEKLLRSQIEKGISLGKIRPINAAMATRLLLSGLNAIPRWHNPNGPMSSVDVIEEYVGFVLDGIAVSEPAGSSPAG